MTKYNNFMKEATLDISRPGSDVANKGGGPMVYGHDGALGADQLKKAAVAFQKAQPKVNQQLLDDPIEDAEGHRDFVGMGDGSVKVSLAGNPVARVEPTGEVKMGDTFYNEAKKVLDSMDKSLSKIL